MSYDTPISAKDLLKVFEEVGEERIQEIVIIDLKKLKKFGKAYYAPLQIKVENKLYNAIKFKKEKLLFTVNQPTDDEEIKKLDLRPSFTVGKYPDGMVVENEKYTNKPKNPENISTLYKITYYMDLALSYYHENAVRENRIMTPINYGKMSEKQLEKLEKEKVTPLVLTCAEFYPSCKVMKGKEKRNNPIVSIKLYEQPNPEGGLPYYPVLREKNEQGRMVEARLENELVGPHNIYEYAKRTMEFKSTIRFGVKTHPYGISLNLKLLAAAVDQNSGFMKQETDFDTILDLGSDYEDATEEQPKTSNIKIIKQKPKRPSPKNYKKLVETGDLFISKKKSKKINKIVDDEEYLTSESSSE